MINFCKKDVAIYFIAIISVGALAAGAEALDKSLNKVGNQKMNQCLERGVDYDFCNYLIN